MISTTTELALKQLASNAEGYSWYNVYYVNILSGKGLLQPNSGLARLMLQHVVQTFHYNGNWKLFTEIVKQRQHKDILSLSKNLSLLPIKYGFILSVHALGL